MTDTFILLAAVTVLCTGAAIPCFFKSSRNTAGFLILTVAVLSATAACFVTPLKACFASFTRFDAWYYIILFAAAFLVSLFYRLLLGIVIILYALWCAAFLIFLLPAGYSPSSTLGEVTVWSSQENFCVLEKVTLSPYHLLPYRKNWYRSSQESGETSLNQVALRFFAFTGAVSSSDDVPLPESATYPHVYILSIDAMEKPVFETVF